jgi:RimJ/RimL family protein N-acetyltransferase
VGIVAADIAWVRLELDVGSFDATAFTTILSDVEASGIRLTTLAELGNAAEQQRSLYELNAECSADIPNRGPFHSWAEYKRVRLEVPSFHADGVTLAIHGDTWVGMSAMSHRDGYDYAFSEMTGVVRSHRHRGLALAMKVAGMTFVRDLGVSTVRTVHHPGNQAMINLNRKLGYVDATWNYPLR